MIKARVLTGEELVTGSVARTTATLPEAGIKAVLPDGSWLERKQVGAALLARKQLIQLERIQKCGSISIAEWVPNEQNPEDVGEEEVRGTVLVTHKSGSIWTHYGYMHNNQLYLHPQEAIFLMEINNLRLLSGGVPLSLQAARALLLAAPAAAARYQVYAHFSRIGLRLRPSLPPHAGPGDPVVEAEAEAATPRTEPERGRAASPSAGPRPPAVRGERRRLKRARPSAGKRFPIEKCFERIPEMTGQIAVSLRAPPRSYLPAAVDLGERTYRVDLRSAQAARREARPAAAGGPRRPAEGPGPARRLGPYGAASLSGMRRSSLYAFPGLRRPIFVLANEFFVPAFAWAPLATPAPRARCAWAGRAARRRRPEEPSHEARGARGPGEGAEAAGGPGLRAVAALAGRLRALEARGAAGSGHRRALAQLVRLYNDTYGADVRVDGDLRSGGAVDSDSDSDRAAPESKKLRNPFSALGGAPRRARPEGPSRSASASAAADAARVREALGEPWTPPEADFGGPAPAPAADRGSRLADARAEGFLYDFLQSRRARYRGWGELKAAFRRRLAPPARAPDAALAVAARLRLVAAHREPEPGAASACAFDVREADERPSDRREPRFRIACFDAAAGVRGARELRGRVRAARGARLAACAARPGWPAPLCAELALPPPPPSPILRL